MEKWIKKLAQLWCKVDDSIDRVFEQRILKNNNAIFLFSMTFIAVFGLVISVFYSFGSFAQRILFFIGYLFIGFIALTIAAVHNEKKRIKNGRLYPFHYKDIKWDTVNLEALGFDKEERIDFNLLLNRRRVQNRINFREKNKSKEGANHRMLFSLFHVLLRDGIANFTNVQKKDFFEMLTDSFLMNNKPINYDTLKSSFSSWKSDLSSDKGKSYIQYWKEIFGLT